MKASSWSVPLLLGALICTEVAQGAPLRNRSVAAAAPQPGQDADLVPFVGETPSEFEARLRGRPQEAARERTARIARDPSGHYFTEAVVNGTMIRLMIDTGASSVTLTAEDAEHLGLRPARSEFTRRVATANGITLSAPVKLSEVGVGEVSLTNVQALVSEPGHLSISLLGMSFLNRLTGFEMQAGQFILRQRKY